MFLFAHVADIDVVFKLLLVVSAVNNKFSLNAFRYASDSGDPHVLEPMREYLLNTIQKTFEVSIDQAECLLGELLMCTKNKNLVSAMGHWTIQQAV